MRKEHYYSLVGVSSVEHGFYKPLELRGQPGQCCNFIVSQGKPNPWIREAEFVENRHRNLFSTIYEPSWIEISSNLGLYLGLVISSTCRRVHLRELRTYCWGGHRHGLLMESLLMADFMGSQAALVKVSLLATRDWTLEGTFVSLHNMGLHGVSCEWPVKLSCWTSRGKGDIRTDAHLYVLTYVSSSDLLFWTSCRNVSRHKACLSSADKALTCVFSCARHAYWSQNTLWQLGT